MFCENVIKGIGYVVNKWLMKGCVKLVYINCFLCFMGDIEVGY